MKSTRKAPTNKRSGRDRAMLIARGRILPAEQNTRPATFVDRKKKANKNACRGKDWGG